MAWMVLALATTVAPACASPSPPEPTCSCVGSVPGGDLNVICGEAQCVAGTRYRCTGVNTAVSEGSCAAANPRPVDAPDVVVFAVSGHCFPSCPAAPPNPEYLVAERGTIGVVTSVYERNSHTTGVLAYGDSFYDYVDDSGNIVLAGFLSLLSDLAYVRDNWVGDFDNPSRVVVVAHSHGDVWAHLALDVLERLGEPVPVDILVDLDGTSIGWENDLATGFIGDTWKPVIRQYNADTGTEWPFEISDCADYWLIDGVADAQDEEDVVPNSVAVNLEVFSSSVVGPHDPDPNHRRDGSQRTIASFGSTGDHNAVTYPGSDAMNWVATQIAAAYGW